MVAIVTVVMAFATAGSSAFLLLIMEAFPPRVRATALATIYSFGVTIFGGFAQFNVTWLLHRTGDPMSPAWYVLACGAVSMIAQALPRAPGRFASRRPLSGAPLHSRRRRTPAAPLNQTTESATSTRARAGPARLRFARRRSRHHETNVRNSTLMAACCAATCMWAAPARANVQIYGALDSPAIRAHRQPDERRPDERRCIDVALRLHRQRGSRRRPARELPPRKRLRPDVRPPAKRGISSTTAKPTWRSAPRTGDDQARQAVSGDRAGSGRSVLSRRPVVAVRQHRADRQRSRARCRLLPGRIENAISYKTATYGGPDVTVLYAFRNAAGASPIASNAGAVANFARGPVMLSGAYNAMWAATSSTPGGAPDGARTDSVMASASYAFGPTLASFAYTLMRPTAPGTLVAQVYSLGAIWQRPARDPRRPRVSHDRRPGEPCARCAARLRLPVFETHRCVHTARRLQEHRTVGAVVRLRAHIRPRHGQHRSPLASGRNSDRASLFTGAIHDFTRPRFHRQPACAIHRAVRPDLEPRRVALRGIRVDRPAHPDAGRSRLSRDARRGRHSDRVHRRSRSRRPRDRHPR